MSYGVVKIGGVDVPMAANAATPIRYNQIFHDGYYKTVTDGTITTEQRIEFFEKVGFVMAKQAEKADMSKIREEDFFIWLEGFEVNDLINAVDDIADVYQGNQARESAPKEQAAQPTGR